MALTFKGETSVNALNSNRAGFGNGWLFRVYDDGVLYPNKIAINHGDFVSWDGTNNKWKFESPESVRYALTTDPVPDNLVERVSNIEDVIPEDASEENKLSTASDINAINAKIPDDASTSNKLATKSEIADINAKIPDDASSSNKLTTEDDLNNAVEQFGSGYVPKGPATVTTLNAGPTGIENGWSYILTDGGTLTDGSLVVVAGDTVAWDADNSVWYKMNPVQYAFAIYGTNAIKSLPNKYKGFMALDDADGTGKMDVDTIFNNFAPKFVPNSTTTVAGYPYVYNGSLYAAKEAYNGPWDASKFAKVNVGNYFSDDLRGKKWYACGDSYTAGVSASGTITDDGPYKGSRAVYPYFIGNRTGMDVHNIAVAGSTITYSSESSTTENCFSYPETGLYLSIPSDADYITLKFGINDYYEALPVGCIDDETNETLYGAWNVVMGHIRSNCPMAKIGIIVSNRAIAVYSKAARDVAVRWGVPYLDENFDPAVPLLNDVTGKPDVLSSVKDIVNSNFRMSSTNIHPTDDAHYFESTIVENFLRSL